MSGSGSSRNQALDVIRGVAILMVIIHHCGPEMIPSQPELTGAAGAAFWGLKNLGWSGVDLFFVLSGFLIGGLLFSEIERSGGIRCGRFWLRRGFKIWPSYYVLLLVLALSAQTRWLDLDSAWQGLQDLLVHGLFLQNYLDQGVNGPTWSLAVEEHFYLLLPLLLLLLRTGTGAGGVPARRYHVFFAVAIGGGLLLRSWHVLIDGGPRENDFMVSHFRFDSLILGVALQYYRRNYGPRLGGLLRRHPRLLLALAVTLLLPTQLSSRNDPFMFSIGFTSLAAGYGILLLLVLEFAPAQTRLLSAAQPLAVVGRWSYNIYLWHFFVPLLVPGYWAVQQHIGGLGAPPALIVALQSVVYAALVIAAGALMTWLVENPALAWRDRWLPARTPVSVMGSAAPAAGVPAAGAPAAGAPGSDAGR